MDVDVLHKRVWPFVTMHWRLLGVKDLRETSIRDDSQWT